MRGKLDKITNVANEIIDVIKKSKVHEDYAFDLADVLAKVLGEFDFDYGTDGDTYSKDTIYGKVIKDATESHMGHRMKPYINKFLALHSFLESTTNTEWKNAGAGDREMCVLPTKNRNKIIRYRNQNMDAMLILIAGREYGSIPTEYELHIRGISPEFIEYQQLSLNEILPLSFISDENYNRMSDKNEERYMWYGDSRDKHYILSLKDSRHSPKVTDVSPNSLYIWEEFRWALNLLPKEYIIQYNREEKLAQIERSQKAQEEANKPGHAEKSKKEILDMLNSLLK